MREQFGTFPRVAGLRTVSKLEVPLVFREPYVESGFRPVNQPWSYYAISLFKLHNESMNVWTHLLACVMMAYKLIEYSKAVDFVNDSLTWPLLAGLLCGVVLYATSAGAHCLQSKSELAHYTAFMFDYAGVSIYGLGSVIIHLAYSSEDSFYDLLGPYLVPLGSIFAILICFCCSISKVLYTRPYPFVRRLWQMIPVAGIYIVLISPIAHRLYMCGIYGMDCNDSISLHVRQILWFLISGFFFASEFPQCLKAGLCDHFFHSHQIFHISIMLSTKYQVDAAFIDFHVLGEHLRKRPEPTLTGTFGPIVIVLLIELALIAIIYEVIKSRLHSSHKECSADKTED